MVYKVLLVELRLIDIEQLKFINNWTLIMIKNTSFSPIFRMILRKEFQIVFVIYRRNS